ncbi:type I-E CRISPR-associated protein Cse2/CasB [Streptomyces sp. CBMA156]|uniref:type I-E CRISPR-associated protein Cse2/CasB n=1 Tax=Streptomyces sp. CBMA156 TaxID=1930280 RepID=UPI001D5A131A|nr:type I-E CRISPR-associated protein Cse2/CasB [Streptomyces sp. CBMA156]MBD0670756.1 type I-E CRISPR-associated protein Cse2/CasB [Streptomyces sp. CBMA156]
MSNTITIPGPATPADDEVRPARESVLIPSLGRARAFTTRIDQRSHDDPGVRAALRRGVGKDLDAVPFMHRFVASWLTDEQARSRDVQRAFYTVASLIAAQRRDQYAAAKAATSKKGQASKDEPTTPEVTTAEAATDAPSAPADPTAGGTEPATIRRIPPRSLGQAFADGVLKGGQGAGLREISAETRLNLLTRQSVDGLHRHLPGAVRQLRGGDVEIDWAQLLVDLCQWRRRSGAIKRKWLQDYHRALERDGERRAREQDDDRADGDTTAGADEANAGGDDADLES